MRRKAAMKKILTLLLTLLTLLPLTGCLDLVTEEAKEFFNNLYLQYEQSSGGEADDEPVFVEDTNSYGYYYDQLSDDSKVVYRSIYLDSKNTEGIPIVFRKPLVFSVTAEEADALDETVRLGISRIVQPALDALLYDHPGINWIAMAEETGSTFHIFSRKETDESGNVTLTVKQLSFQMVYRDALTADCVVARENALNEAISLAGLGIPEGANRYEILSALQAYLCKTVTYDIEAPRAHEAAGALLDRAAVCDGYAKAFKLLCDAYEIPCLIVPGTATQNGKTEPHAWNYVQMEDGKWYAVDVTWDDRGEKAEDDYFLVGSGTVTSMTLGHFENSHRENGKFSSGDYQPFTFPDLSFFRYSVPMIPGAWQRETA